ncbi:hypothetical protein GS504_01715 [Rhodococcus hoagii]|nr:hypothetical protein [Prescottella equi]NKS71612.1 hypothetical protein [Prescottella equi]
MATRLNRLFPTEFVANPRVDLRYLDDVILLDAEGAYTLVAIPSTSWDMLTADEKIAELARTETGLSPLPSGDKTLARLLTTTFRFDPTRWHREFVDHVYARTTPAPGFDAYMDCSRDALAEFNWPIKYVYLSVRLGDRGNFDGFAGKWNRLKARFSDAVEFADEMPDAKEVAHWHTIANDLRGSLARGGLRAEPVGIGEAEMLLLHLFHPGTDVPSPRSIDPRAYGPGELRTMLGGRTEVVELGQVGKYKYKCLHHDSQMGEAYSIWFALSGGPKEVPFPEVQWLNIAPHVGANVVQSVGFHIYSPADSRKIATKALKSVDQQKYNDQEAGVATDLAVQEKGEELVGMQYLVDRTRKSFTHMRAVFGIADTDLDVLRDKARDLVGAFSDSGFTVDADPDEQRNLFYESAPTGRSHDSDYQRLVPLTYIAGGMPHISPSVGDRVGPYQGTTVSDQGTRGEPVFVDHMQYATRGQDASTEGVFGDPGTGKTVSRGLKPVFEDMLRGTTCALWDPKGDYLSIAANAVELGLDPNRITVVNLLDAPEGMLCPGAMAASDDQAASNNRDALMRLAPRHTSGDKGEEFEDVIRRAVNAAIGEGRRDLTRVVEILELWGDESVATSTPAEQIRQQRSSQLALVYRDISKTDLGHVIFGLPQSDFSIPVGNTVIFCTLGLTLPDVGKPITEMQEAELVSEVIFGLMADYTWSLMVKLPPEVPKMINWDEWHMNKDNPRARALVDRIKRLGRSRNCFLRLISQSARDVEGSFITGVWVFASKSKEDARAACELLGRQPTPENIGLVQGLSGLKGQCVFGDGRTSGVGAGSLSRMVVEFHDRVYLDLFDTNPEKAIKSIANVLGSDAAEARRKLEADRKAAERSTAA